MGQHRPRHSKGWPDPPYEAPRWRYLLWLVVKKTGQFLLLLVLVFVIEFLIIVPLLFGVWQLMLWASRQ